MYYFIKNQNAMNCNCKINQLRIVKLYTKNNIKKYTYNKNQIIYMLHIIDQSFKT